VKLTLLFEFDEDTEHIIVSCPELGVCTCGKNMPDAFDMIGDACATYWLALEDLEEVENKIREVAERIDAPQSEIEQDIADAIKVVRDYGSPAENLAHLLSNGLTAEEWQEIIEEPYG